MRSNASEPSDSHRIMVEPLRTARVHQMRSSNTECVLQFTTADRHFFLSLEIEELARLGERLVLDAKILTSGNFSGRA